MNQYEDAPWPTNYSLLMFPPSSEFRKLCTRVSRNKVRRRPPSS